MDTKSFIDKNLNSQIDDLILLLEENGFSIGCNNNNHIQGIRNTCLKKGTFGNYMHIHIFDIRPFYCNLKLCKVYSDDISVISCYNADLKTTLYFIYAFYDIVFEILDKHKGSLFNFRYEEDFEENGNIIFSIFTTFTSRIENIVELYAIIYTLDERIKDRYKFDVKLLT